MIDFSTKLGERAAKRLKEEHVAWITTVTSNGTPQPNPVWFFWDGEKILVYSQPTSHKLKNIRTNPRVSLNFQATDDGDDVMVLTGDATIDENSKHDSRFLEKYAKHIPAIGHTPESLAKAYSVLIRISPDKLRGF